MTRQVRSTRSGVGLLLGVVVLVLTVVTAVGPASAGVAGSVTRDASADSSRDDDHEPDHDDHDHDADDHDDDHGHDHGDDDHDHDADDHDHDHDADDHDAGEVLVATCTGERIVDLGVRLIARPGDASATVSVSPTVGPGTWTVSSVSLDAYPGRARTLQTREQWLVDLLDTSGGVLATLGPTSDVPDGVDAAAVTDRLGTVTVTAPVAALRVRHVLAPVPGGTDSVTAVCLGLTPRDGGAPPTTTVPGSSTTLPPGVTTTTVPGSSTTPPPGVTTTAPPGGTPAGGTVTAAPGRPLVVVRATRVDCAARSLQVDLANRGRTDAAIDVAVSRAGVTTGVVLGAGATTTSTVALNPDVENRRIDVRILDHGTGAVLARSAVDVDCDAPARPAASLVVDCPTGVVRLTLTNRGGETVRLTVVRVRREAVPDVEVAPGSVVEITFAADSDDDEFVVVGPEGDEVLRRRIEVDCPRPDLGLDAGIDCAGSRVVARVTNDGELDQTVTVTIGAEVHRVDVAPAATVTLDAALVGPEPVRVPVAATVDGREIGRLELEADCVDPVASVSAGCRSLVLTLGDDGPGIARFTVTVTDDGVELLRRPVVVAGGRHSVTIPLPDAGTWRIRVDEATETAPLAVAEARDDCVPAAAELVVDCGADRATVHLTAGDSAAAATVLVDGRVVATLDAAAGGRASTVVEQPRGTLEIRGVAGELLAGGTGCPVGVPSGRAAVAWAVMTGAVLASLVASWRWRV